MRRLTSFLSAAVLAATATIAASAAPVSAATQIWTYAGSAGGTQVSALGTLINSGITAASNMSDSTVPKSNQVQVASVSVPGLVNVGAITTGQKAEAFGDGVKLTSSAKVAGINLLNGLIKADAVDSFTFGTAKDATADGAALTGGGATTFLRLTIAGTAYPATVPANTKITIPGIAEIVLNELKVEKFTTAKTVRSVGTAVHVTLLKAQGGAPIGSEIKLNLTRATVFPTGEADALPLGGYAYGTYAAVKVSDGVQVLSRPTGLVSLPSYGTNGVPYTNETLNVDVPGLATLGAIRSTINGKSIPGFADVANSAQVAKVNVLDGLITADAIEVTAHVRKAGADQVSEARTNLVNLVIAGKKIPFNVAPNTRISLLGIGVVHVNQQVIKPGYAAVAGVRLILSVARFGLPAGADIHLAVAGSYIYG